MKESLVSVHCPQCGKSYVVQGRGASGLELETHIICTSCSLEFPWQSPAEDSESSSSKELESCPFCYLELPRGAAECTGCGRVVAKYPWLKEREVLGDISSPLYESLQSSWQEVVAHFDQPETHRQFINLCAEFEHLDFAKHRYQNLMTLIGYDEEVEKRINIIDLWMAKKEEEASKRVKVQSQKSWKWQVVGYGTGFIFLALASTFPALNSFSFIGIMILLGFLLYGIK